MTFYQFFIKELTDSGMFKNQSEEIMRRVMEQDDTMKDRWSDDVSGYPAGVLFAIRISVKAKALEYIKEECPEAWFRPMFDKEHPMWFEWNKQQQHEGDK